METGGEWEGRHLERMESPTLKSNREIAQRVDMQERMDHGEE